MGVIPIAQPGKKGPLLSAEHFPPTHTHTHTYHITDMLKITHTYKGLLIPPHTSTPIAQEMLQLSMRKWMAPWHMAKGGACSRLCVFLCVLHSEPFGLELDICFLAVQHTAPC